MCSSTPPSKHHKSVGTNEKEIDRTDRLAAKRYTKRTEYHAELMTPLWALALSQLGCGRSTGNDFFSFAYSAHPGRPPGHVKSCLGLPPVRRLCVPRRSHRDRENTDRPRENARKAIYPSRRNRDPGPRTLTRAAGRRPPPPPVPVLLRPVLLFLIRKGKKPRRCPCWPHCTRARVPCLYATGPACQPCARRYFQGIRLIPMKIS